MINRFKALFQGLREGEAEPAAFHDKHIAAAALMVEAAAMDGRIDAEEEAAIRTALKRFSFAEEEVDTLVAEGRGRAEATSQLVKFTQAIKDACDYDERIAIVEMLWEVAYADGVLHHYESNLLRRVGGLLYVSDRDNGAARKRVLERLGIDPGGTGAPS